MDALFRLFLKLSNFLGEIRFGTAMRIALIFLGVGTLYLLTIREDERGRIEDYISRLWDRIYKLRGRALSRHLTFLRVASTAITSFMDTLFGATLVSFQAIGVSVAFAFVSLNLYMFMSNAKKDADHLLDVTVFLSFALFPSVVNALSRKKRKKTFNRLWKFVWITVLILYIFNEYSDVFCTSCAPLPAKYQDFLFNAILMLISVAVVNGILFTLFVWLTRLSLKKLSKVTSSARAILCLLIGALPIGIFWVLLKLALFIVNRTLDASSASGDITGKEWVGLSSLVVFALSFYSNIAFFITPSLFFSMATLLLLHRLLWPLIERPLETLSRVGVFKHRRIIMVVGVALILLGTGKIEWLEKLLKVF